MMGEPFTEWDQWVFRHSPLELAADATLLSTEDPAISEDEAFRLMHIGLNSTVNKAVVVVRAAITVEKGLGLPTIKVRRGLRLPSWWQDCYISVYDTDLPWMISAILQRAFMGNPASGERKPWKSL
ncbi:hypothetical protein E3O55_09900 [Cryobacterium sp. MDB1-18-2]|uniref:hypothetical protein n=1 Tax=unclassified Cryobacterium TaxID=2649013 RepID=UPI00106C0BA8|nr:MULTISPECIES: hypothetical protein [unclassified Cryobacterium]TFC29178.1 hypothetical protein E3O55_09900 [Cryobacterium sp. MDB1-18-2]TFC45540.1 hypothetical protein E3O50_03570 [Cryobacterium sp. MDB1-18-1]